MITVNKQLTLTDLRKIPCARPPDAGGYWQGIPHAALVDTLLVEFAVRGWQVGNMRFALANDNADLAATFALDLPGLAAPVGLQYAIGALTSNARNRRLRLYAGAVVSLSGTGLVTGELVMCRKHVRGVLLQKEIAVALDDYPVAARRTGPIVEGLQRTAISSVDYEHLLIAAGRAGIMPWSRLSAVDKQYHRNAQGTSWALLGAFTHVVRRNPPIKQLDQINKFRQLLPTAAA